MLAETRFYLTKADPCPRCGGTGKIENSLWQKWLEAKVKGKALADFCEQHKNTGWPFEQFNPCRDCAGTGEQRSETDLTSALAELGVINVAE